MHEHAHTSNLLSTNEAYERLTDVRPGIMVHLEQLKKIADLLMDNRSNLPLQVASPAIVTDDIFSYRVPSTCYFMLATPNWLWSVPRRIIHCDRAPRFLAALENFSESLIVIENIENPEKA